MKLDEVVTEFFIHSFWQLFVKIQVLSVKSRLLMDPKRESILATLFYEQLVTTPTGALAIESEDTVTKSLFS